MSTNINAERFIEQLKSHLSPTELKKNQRYFKTGAGDYAEDDVFIGVRMGQIFALAKEFIEMRLKEVEKLLESPMHEVRVGAVSVMDWQARSKKTPDSHRKELFDLYIRRHDRINNWDLVDSTNSICSWWLSDRQTTRYFVQTSSIKKYMGTSHSYCQHLLFYKAR